MEDPAIRLMRLAVGGATRPDSFTGMDTRFLTALDTMISAAPADIQKQLRVGSGYRSIARQQQLWDASDKSGKMVARPGHSQHNFGRAADLKYLGDDAKSWVQQNAADYGLAFPMSYEPWHIELAGARGMAREAPVATAPDASQLLADSKGVPQGPQADGTPLSAPQNLIQAVIQQANGIGQPQSQAKGYQPSWMENNDFGGKAILNDVFSGQNPLRRLAYQGLKGLFT